MPAQAYLQWQREGRHLGFRGLTLCNPMDCSTPGFPVHHQLPELAQAHVHCVGDAIQSAWMGRGSCGPQTHLLSVQGLPQPFSTQS